jgi:hypothetical protein
VKITQYAVGWVEHEVQTWLVERIEQFRSHPTAPFVRKKSSSRGGCRTERPLVVAPRNLLCCCWQPCSPVTP